MVSAWSIPQAKRSNISSNEGVPGPSNYQVGNKVFHVIKTEAPKYSIGASNRSDLCINNSPSPGAYQLPNFLGKESPKYFIGEKRSNNFEEREKSGIPGPNQYSPNPFSKRAPAFTIPGRHGSGSESPLGGRSMSPGPGKYETNKSTLDNHALAKMGNMKREGLAFNRDIPGPGSYNIGKANSDIKQSPPNYSIGNQERVGFGGGSNIPGVGQYNVNKSMFSSRGGLIGTKGNQPKPETSPGVGQYHIDRSLKDKSKMGCIGKEKRKSLGQSNNFPSPGSYELWDAERFKLKNNPKFSIGHSVRAPLSSSDVPGPEHYQGKELWNSNRGITIAGKQPLDKYLDAPGPQSYKPDYHVVQKKQGAFSTSKSQRTGVVNLKEKASIPGPSDYRNYEAKKFTAPQYSFGKQLRSEPQRSGSPGPGQYYLPPKFADVPKYLLPLNKQQQPV